MVDLDPDKDPEDVNENVTIVKPMAASKAIYKHFGDGADLDELAMIYSQVFCDGPVQVVDEEQGVGSDLFEDGLRHYPDKPKRDPNIPVLSFEVQSAPDEPKIRYDILIAGRNEYIKQICRKTGYGTECSMVVREYGPSGTREVEHYLYDASTWGWLGRLMASAGILNIKQLSKNDVELHHESQPKGESGEEDQAQTQTPPAGAEPQAGPGEDPGGGSVP